MTDQNLLLPSTTPEEKHIVDWLDLILDAIDGDLEAGSQIRLDEHMATCKICSAEYERLKAMDVALDRALPGETLCSSFDRRVLAMTKTMDAEAKEKARQRVAEENARAMRNLERGWKHTLHRLVAYFGVVTLTTIALTIGLNAVLVSVWPAVVKAFPGMGLPADVSAAAVVALTIVGLGIAAWFAAAGNGRGRSTN